MSHDRVHQDSQLSDMKRRLLAQRLRGKNLQGSQPQAISRVPRSEPGPLSFSQQRLWFLDQFEESDKVCSSRFSDLTGGTAQTSDKSLTTNIFHVVNRRPLDWTALVAWIASLGYPMQQLTYERWRKLLHQHGDTNELAPLWPIFQAAEPSPDMLRFASWNTIAGLEGAAIACPRMDAALLHTYFAYFLRQKFIAPPERLDSGEI